MARFLKITIQRVCIVVLICTMCGCASQSRNEAFLLAEQADRAYEQGRWYEASVGYQKLTDVVPKDQYAWFRLANTQLHTGHIDAAIFNFGEALKRDPEHAKAHFNLSIAYILKSIESMERSNQSMRKNDSGQQLVTQRIAALKQLIIQPIENSPVSPNR